MSNVLTAFVEGFFGAIMLFLVLGGCLIAAVLVLILIIVALAASIVLAPFALIAAGVTYFWPKRNSA